jgi:hypothetical protein
VDAVAYLLNVSVWLPEQVSVGRKYGSWRPRAAGIVVDVHDNQVLVLWLLLLDVRSGLQEQLSMAREYEAAAELAGRDHC